VKDMTEVDGKEMAVKRLGSTDRVRVMRSVDGSSVDGES
jgi:hypothetical protein